MADSVMDRSESSGTGGGFVLRHITARSSKSVRSSKLIMLALLITCVNDVGDQVTAGFNDSGHHRHQRSICRQCRLCTRLNVSKHEKFVARIFIQIRLVWIGELETRLKTSNN
jgi:preprotein translocase subunit Sec63